MKRVSKKWESLLEDDPLAGLVNLFDVWVVFAIALLVSLLGAVRASQLAEAGRISKTTEVSQEDRTKLDRYRVSVEKLSGEGTRLGTAYRLESGEVVYVPD